MDRAAEILVEVKDINKTVTQMQLDHRDLLVRNDEQHKSMNKSILLLSGQIGDQEGRVKKIEHFKTVILTKIKVIPATISTIFGIITVAIAMYFRS